MDYYQHRQGGNSSVFFEIFRGASLLPCRQQSRFLMLLVITIIFLVLTEKREAFDTVV